MIHDFAIMVEIHETLKAVADSRNKRFEQIERDLNKC